MDSRWQEHAGEYRAGPGGAQVFVAPAREGLCLQFRLSRGPQSIRLTEFRPGVFLTSDGRAVAFREGVMDFGGLRFVREKSG
jgi:hypothetical protein